MADPSVPVAAVSSSKDVAASKTAAAAAKTMNSKSVFPTQKIKAALHKQPDMGMMRQPTADLIGACSALFVKGLVETAAQQKQKQQQQPNSSTAAPTVLTVKDLQPVIERCSLLKGVLDGLEEGVHATIPPPSKKKQRTNSAVSQPSAASNSSSKRRAKKQRTLDDVTTTVAEEALQLVQQGGGDAKTATVNQQAATAVTAPHLKQVVPDEDDYD